MGIERFKEEKDKLKSVPSNRIDQLMDQLEYRQTDVCEIRMRIETIRDILHPIKNTDR